MPKGSKEYQVRGVHYCMHVCMPFVYQSMLPFVCQPMLTHIVSVLLANVCVWFWQAWLASLPQCVVVAGVVQG
jgi:hypothetical protein